MENKNIKVKTTKYFYFFDLFRKIKDSLYSSKIHLYLVLFPFFVFAGEGYFVPSGYTEKNIQALNELYKQKANYNNSYSVIFYIHHIISKNNLKGQKADWLSHKVEQDISTYDFSGLTQDDYNWFLREKSFYHYLRKEDDEALADLKKIILIPPNIINDYHGAIGIKRGAVTSIIEDALNQGDIFRPIKYFFSSGDVFTVTEKTFGIFILPFFAVKINPASFFYWLWAFLTVFFPIILIYGLWKLVQKLVQRFKFQVHH